MILVGDCREVMAGLDAASFDAIVCDPPYGLEFMGSEWDAPWKHGFAEHGAAEHLTAPRFASTRNPVCRSCRKMQRGADGCRCEEPDFDERPADFSRAFQEWCGTWAREAMRVLRPGGFLLAFGGTRTYHRLTCAIEDAGFELRDSIHWLYAGGFPKSHNISCRCEDGGRVPGGSASEHDLRRLPDADLSETVDAEDQRGEVLLAGVPEQGASVVGAVPAAGPAGERERVVEGRGDAQAGEGELRGREVCAGADVGAADGEEGRVHLGAPAGDGADAGEAADPAGGGSSPGSRPVEQPAGEPGAVRVERGAQAGGGSAETCPSCGLPRGDLGTALKPAHEPIIVARKPLSGTVLANYREHGTGVLNIGAARVGWASDEDEDESKQKNRHADFGSGPMTNKVYGKFEKDRAEVGNYDPEGRWPANVVLTHSPDCVPIGTETVKADGHFPNGSKPSAFQGKGFEGRDGWQVADDVVEMFECAPGCPVAALDAATGTSPAKAGRVGLRGGTAWHGQEGFGSPDGEGRWPVDPGGGGSRFFFCGKTTRAERDAGLDDTFEKRALNWSSGEESPGTFQSDETEREARNFHPTVKPIDLMRWLLSLVALPGARVLDPFAGSGSTVCAGAVVGVEVVGIEQDAEFARIAEARAAFWLEHGAEGFRVCRVIDSGRRRRRKRADAGQLDLLAGA